MARHVNTMENQSAVSIVLTLKPLLVSLCVTFVSLCLLALCIAFGPVTENTADLCILLVTILSLFLAGFLSARQKTSRGFITGGIAGLLYVFAAYLIAALAFGSFSPGRDFIKLFLLGIGIGALGGIVGVNTRRKTR